MEPYLKESIEFISNPLEKIFNYILEKKSFLKQWSKGVINSIYKKEIRVNQVTTGRLLW